MMSDFERIELDPDSESVHYEKPDYAQVIFHHIAETYPTDAHIECQYTVTAPLVVTSRDWIGLYRVGWSSHRDYVYFMWAPVPSGYQQGQEVNSKVLFQAQCLPKDDGEFYQFCYVTNKGCVRGASVPFQFKHPTANDYVGIEVGDMMIIKSRTVALEESLAEAKSEKDKLAKHLELLELERDSLLTKLVDSERQLKEEKISNERSSNQLSEVQDRKVQLENEAANMAKITDSLKEKLTVVNQEKRGLEKKVEEKDGYIASLQEKIKALINEKDALCGKNKSLEQEKELFKNHFTTSEKTIQAYQLSIEKSRKQIAELESASVQLTMTNCDLKSQIEEEQVRVRQLVENKDSEGEKNGLLLQRLQNTEDKLTAAEEICDMLKKETHAQCQVIAKMSSDLEEAKTEAHNLKTVQTHTEREHKAEKTSWLDEKTELQAKIRVFVKEEERLLAKIYQLSESLSNLEEKTSVEEGSLHALQVAQTHLKERYSKMKKEFEELKKDKDDLLAKKQSQEAVESDLQREIADLKERLAMGADEYKAKYLEARKLESEIRRLRRQMRQLVIGDFKGKDVTDVECEQLQASPAKPLSEVGTTQTVILQTSEAATTAKAETFDVSTSSKVITTEASTSVKADTSEAATITKTPEYLLDSGSQTDDWYDMPELEEVLVESEIGQRSATGAAAPQTEPTVPDLCNTELQAQLADLGRELTVRRNKQHKYKQLYLDEKDKSNFLQKHYYGELQKKDGMISDLETQYRELNEGLCGQIVSLQQTIEEQRQQLNNLRSLSNSVEQAASSASAAAEVVHELDPLQSADASPLLRAPLTPLPAPIQPQVLPIAKMAAVKHINQVPMGDLDLLMTGAQSEDDGPPPLELIDHDDDRFHDADGDPQKLCPVCNTTFPAELPQHVFEDHVDGHYGPVCPMCHEQFALGFDQDDFELHVQSHFEGGN